MAKRGRPSKAPPPGEKASLGLKVTASLKARLEESANESGRTQSQEAEYRLERSFDRQNILRDVLELSYGPHLAGFVQAVGDAAFRTVAATHALFYIQKNVDPATVTPFNRALLEPWIFDQVARCTMAIIEYLRPPGSTEPPSDFADNWAATDAGEHWADSLIGIMKELHANRLKGVPAGPDDDRIQWAVESLADLLQLKEQRK